MTPAPSHSEPAGGETTRDDRQLLHRFEACTLPEEQFHHAEHVRVAFLMLREDPLPRALERFVEGLKRFASALGKSGLYHETITLAYLFLIHERIERDRSAAVLGGFEEFSLRHPELLERRPSVLERYYSEETLSSELARRCFVLPDRLAPLAG